MDSITLAWSIFGLVLMAILLFNYLLVKYYTDPAESYGLATFTIAFSLTVTLLTVLLIPVDVYVVSIGHTSFANLQISREMVKDLYTVLYILMVVDAFFLIPFSYFYGEERMDEIDGFDNPCQQICNALKYTVYFIILLGILILTVLVVRPDQKMGLTQGKETEWLKSVLDLDHFGDAAIAFLISCLTVLGTLAWVFYTAHGLATLPVFLIKGTRSLESTKSEVDFDIAKIREKYRSIQEKASKKKELSRRDQRELNHLKRQERLLAARSDRIQDLKNEEGILSKLLSILTPFRVIIGVATLVLSGLVFVSLLISVTNKFMHSTCGWKCGYASTKNSEWNPLDTTLVFSSKFFPLDYIAFGILVCYIFLASIYGIMNLGIKFLFFTIFKFKRRRTQPQALLIMTMIVGVLILVLSQEILTMAPQYVTFGDQVVDGVPCSLNMMEKAKQCVVSNVSAFHGRVTLSIPMFSVIFYFVNWAFLGFFAMSFIYAVSSKTKSTLEEEEEEYEDDEERVGLLM